MPAIPEYSRIAGFSVHFVGAYNAPRNIIYYYNKKNKNRKDSIVWGVTQRTRGYMQWGILFQKSEARRPSSTAPFPAISHQKWGEASRGEHACCEQRAIRNRTNEAALLHIKFHFIIRGHYPKFGFGEPFPERIEALAGANERFDDL